MTDTPELTTLLAALTELRERLDAARFPLALPGLAGATARRDALVDQLDNYVLGRLSTYEAPLIAVVGGSTGAGKSTLVNTLAGQVVTAAGVLRPTTMRPVLVHHPDDGFWFAEAGESLDLVASVGVGRGLALIDAPDIDSVVGANRGLAAELLRAADLWVFVTTAARYADAPAWAALREASARSAAVAMVLDRVPEGAGPPIVDELAVTLREQGLEQSPLFVVPEVPLEDDGLLPAVVVEHLRRWLTGLANDPRARSVVVRRTLQGTLGAYEARVPEVVSHLQAQEGAASALTAAIDTAVDDAATVLRRTLQDGSLVRGDVALAWQELQRSADLPALARTWQRLTALGPGARHRLPGDQVTDAVRAALITVIAGAAETARARLDEVWRSLPGGAALAGGVRADETLQQRAGDAVKDWLASVTGRVGPQAAPALVMRLIGARVTSAEGADDTLLASEDLQKAALGVLETERLRLHVLMSTALGEPSTTADQLAAAVTDVRSARGSAS